ncbi:monosaccharide ABC transporter substrate-binding protein (CUT2 family) [Thermohydrogenium kirishiense]|nr:monosaccharide ABC transporter substrate-binding protein (CUT2 family) [Thermohydrogenium kirishiense]
MLMLKKFITLFLSMILVVSLSACGSSNKGTKESAYVSSNNNKTQNVTKFGKYKTDEQFDILKWPDTITFKEMRNRFGPIPKIDGNLKFAGNIKTFQNIVWKEFADGYSAFADTARKAGVNLTVETSSPRSESDAEGQLLILKAQVRKNYNAILLSPITDSNCLPGVDEAHNAGIPVFAVNNNFNGADIFIGPNPLQSGALAAEWISKKIGGKGKVAVVMGMLGTEVTRDRTDGFNTWMKQHSPGIEIVAEQNADWDRSKAKDIATVWLKRYPDLKAIFCNNDVMAMGVIEAVKEAGLKLNKDIYIVGNDGQQEAYQSIKKGELAATVDIFPFYQGEIATEVALRALAGQKIPRVVWTPLTIIDSSNVNKPSAELCGWTDPEFK